MPPLSRPIRMLALLTAIAAPPGGCVRYTIVSDGIARAGIDETAEIGALKVRPLAVLEDSRCPAGTRCVWAGRLVLRAQVIDAGNAVERIFALPSDPAAADGARVVLVEASPEPEANRKLYPEEYRFGFRPAGDVATAPASPRR